MKNYEFEEISINLIPPAGDITGNYLCSFGYQGGVAKHFRLKDNNMSSLRDVLNQDTLFGEENFYHPISRAQRSDLIFLLDDGWDVPYGTPNDPEHKKFFGAIAPDPEKFSNFGNTPAERLKGISDRLKEMGYAGLGLWISPQQCEAGQVVSPDARAYWEERAAWCHEAGVLYWKVDWGKNSSNDDYRKMITEAARKCAPQLIVEHTVVQLPLTYLNSSDTFAEKRASRIGVQMEFCDVYRTYDVIPPFEDVCILYRSSEALCAKTKKAPTGKGLINAESRAVIGAALGLTVGVMTFDTDMKACLNWHRISPPFSAHGVDCFCSEEYLEDTAFCDSEFCDWVSCRGKTVSESAPAAVSRNTPLPQIEPCGDILPFVLAAKNPLTNAYSVATLRRTIDPNRNFYPLADVTVKEVDIDSHIGIFGIFNTLTICFAASIPQNARILVQDMVSEKAIDVTEHIHAEENQLRIDGKLLRVCGKWSRGENDTSVPSLILKIK